MPKQLPTSDVIAERILAKLQDDDRTISWLARKANISDSTLRYQLDNPATMTVRNMLAIAEALGWKLEDLDIGDAEDNILAVAS